MASRLARYDAHRQAAKHARDTADQISHRRLEEMKQSESFYDIYNKYTKPSRYLPSQALTLQDSDIHYDTRPVPIDSEELTQTTKRQKTRGKRGGRATELPRLRIGNQDVDTLEYLGSAEWVDYLVSIKSYYTHLKPITNIARVVYPKRLFYRWRDVANPQERPQAVASSWNRADDPPCSIRVWRWNPGRPSRTRQVSYCTFSSPPITHSRVWLYPRGLQKRELDPVASGSHYAL